MRVHVGCAFEMPAARLALLALLLAPATPVSAKELCTGVASISTGVCCTTGCGQSRLQCSETDDVCKGTHRGDATTKANCCPSVIRAAGERCAPGRDAPCVVDGSLMPGPSLDRPAPLSAVSPPPAPVPCSAPETFKNGSLVRDSAFEMCADFCKAIPMHCAMCGFRRVSRTRVCRIRAPTQQSHACSKTHSPSPHINPTWCWRILAQVQVQGVHVLSRSCAAAHATRAGLLSVCWCGGQRSLL